MKYEELVKISQEVDTALLEYMEEKEPKRRRRKSYRLSKLRLKLNKATEVYYGLA